jgi:hypothetical protein
MSKAPKIDIDEMLRKEWCDLGFYYETDHEKNEWLFAGSKKGLLNFIKCIDEHLKFQKSLSDDSHFGPYSYLKLMTYDKPYIDLKLIAGRKEDFENLKKIYRTKVEVTGVGKEFIVNEDYSQDNSAILRVKIMKTDFDPVSIDSQLSKS